VESVNEHIYEVTEPANIKVYMESKFKVDYELLKKAVKEGWSGKKLGRELGAEIEHELEIVTIDLISFPASDLREDLEDDDFTKYCITCGEPVGSCDH
jgi:hypothetical protein